MPLRALAFGQTISGRFSGQALQRSTLTNIFGWRTSCRGLRSWHLKPNYTILALHDGSASSCDQASALSKAILSLGAGRLLVSDAPFPQRINPFGWMPVWMHAFFSLLCGHVAGAKIPFEALVSRCQKENVDIVIACGSRAAVAGFIAKRALQVHGQPAVINVQILNPRCGTLLSPLLFDFLVAPAHDRIKYTNSISTIGALTWASSPEAVTSVRELYQNNKAIRAPFFQDLDDPNQPNLAVLCGGNTQRELMDIAVVEKEILRGIQLSKVPFKRVYVAGSRRTPPELLDNLIKHGLRVWKPSNEWIAMDGKVDHGDSANAADDNPYKGLIVFGQKFIVTGDSVSMVSDACSTGKPVYVIRDGVDGKTPGSKISRFHIALSETGYMTSIDCLDDEKTARVIDRAPQDAERVASIIVDAISEKQKEVK